MGRHKLRDNAPALVDEWASLRTGQSVGAHESVLLLNDSDPDGDPLVITGYTSPRHGTLLRAADGTLTYTPDAGYTGEDSFTYTVAGGVGASATATVHLSVLPPPQPPTLTEALDDVGALRGPVPSGGRSDDSLPQLGGSADPGARVELFDRDVRIAEGFTSLDGRWILSPATPLAQGVHSLTVLSTAFDGAQGVSAPFTLVIADDGANLPPIVGDDFFWLPAGSSASTPESVLLANDHDPEGAPLSIVGYGQPGHGSLVRAADGTLSYTPEDGFTGIDRFEYRVADPLGATSVGSVMLQVAPDGPLRSVTSAQAIEGSALLFKVTVDASSTPTPLTLVWLDGGGTVGVDTGTPVRVNFGAGWLDVAGDTVLLPAQVGSFQLRLPTIDDTLVEMNETVYLRVVAPNGSSALGSGTVLDNDLQVQVSGLQDTPLTLHWADFGLSTLPGSASHIVVESLPVDGQLQYQDGAGSWRAVDFDQALSRLDIDAGRLRFLPDAGESGHDGYGVRGVGNHLNDYARFTWRADDGLGTPWPSGLMAVDIVPTGAVQAADGSRIWAGDLLADLPGLAALPGAGTGAATSWRAGESAAPSDSASNPAPDYLLWLAPVEPGRVERGWSTHDLG